MSRSGSNTVFDKVAFLHLDAAFVAGHSAAANRFDAHTQLAGCFQKGCPFGNLSAPPGRHKDNMVSGHWLFRHGCWFRVVVFVWLSIAFFGEVT